MNMPKIAKVSLGLVREPLKGAFGFKGASLTELWQVVAGLELEDGTYGMGVGVQSVLWSAPEVFAQYGEAAANQKMYDVTRRALILLQGLPFTTPPQMLSQILEPLTTYAREITGHAKLVPTFALNALVAVDFAMWQLWMASHGAGFNELCGQFAPQMQGREPQLSSIPLISYQTSAEEIHQLLRDGASLLKIKIGAAPDGDHDPIKMLTWDKARIRQIHSIAAQYETPYTQSGSPVYYLDANGRYPSKDLLMRLMDDMDKAGALKQTLILEEPFTQDAPQNVKDLPVRVAGDESAHSVEDVRLLIDEYGYGAIACKPVAKTLSLTLQMASEALRRGAVCFCADLTVPPAMLDWNMAFAARLPRIPGLNVGVVESNGAQNYPDWNMLLRMCLPTQAGWRTPVHGLYRLNSAFYEDAGILARHPAYQVHLQPLEAEK